MHPLLAMLASALLLPLAGLRYQPFVSVLGGMTVLLGLPLVCSNLAGSITQKELRGRGIGALSRGSGSVLRTCKLIVSFLVLLGLGITSLLLGGSREAHGAASPTIQQAAADYYHNLVLKSDGTVWAWGDNGSGQLGDGTTTQRLTPVQVNGLSGVIAVAAGDNHSLVLKGDGTVWAWGWNVFGQLGDGTTTDRITPAQVSGLTGVTAIMATYGRSLALKSDGTVWEWGYNYGGELGDGTTVNRATPVQVAGLSGVTAISVGQYGFHTLALSASLHQ